MGRGPIDLKTTDNIEDLGPGFYRITNQIPVGFPTGIQGFGYMTVKGGGAYRLVTYYNTAGEVCYTTSFTGSNDGKLSTAWSLIG